MVPSLPIPLWFSLFRFSHGSLSSVRIPSQFSSSRKDSLTDLVSSGEVFFFRMLHYKTFHVLTHCAECNLYVYSPRIFLLLISYLIYPR